MDLELADVRGGTPVETATAEPQTLVQDLTGLAATHE
jgi:hypothetical protein